MKKRIFIATLVTGLLFGSLAFAFDNRPMRGRGDWGDSPRHQQVLNHLPEEKAALVRDTLSDAREQTNGIRDQIVTLRNEIKDILSAPQFDETIYLEKNNQMNELRDQMHAVMIGAIAGLARQFTQEERKVLAELVPPGPGGHGGGPGSGRGPRR